MMKDRQKHKHLLFSSKVAKQILRNVYCLAAALLLVAYAPVCLGEEETILKPDVPKLDTAPSIPKGTLLKGNVAHHAKIAPPPKNKPKRLNSRIVRPDIGPLNGLLK